MKRLKISFAIILSFFISAPSFALSKDLLEFYSTNNIYYYNPEGALSCTYGTGAYDGSPTAGLSDLQSAFVDTYHDIAVALSIEYGIPWETVMAQGILESAAGTSNFARERNNFFGIGAFDSNPNNAFSYATPEEGWRGYYENIKNTPTYRNHGAFNYPTDPYGYAQAIKNAGYATDPNYVSKLSSLIAAIENRSKEKGWDSSAELAKKYPQMIANANANANGEGGSGEGGGVATDMCMAGAGNGDINATAIALSWPDRTHSLYDPKPEYKAALEAVGLSTYPDQYARIGASCDAFVATVLRFSGADPDVFCCGAANMLNYFATHPDLYDEIPNIGNSSNLQGGDIRVHEGHVEMYVVLEDGSGAIASASYGGRTGDHAIPYYADSRYRIFRRKQ